MPPDAPIVSGREAIKGCWKEAIRRLGVKDATLTTMKAEVLGDAGPAQASRVEAE